MSAWVTAAVGLLVPSRGGRRTPELLERITARRAELDELEELLAKQLAEVRAEQDELAVAERVLARVSEQLAEPLRGRLVRLVDRGWLRRLPADRSTTGP
ncbi:hypothetical protein ACIBJC_32040 [Streptomyces sp. NPDC050509]|uniref:hypothetical protein n=1 Tax=Streptomyces sp. NPDC050509 TaxID=3365620 RepID=UPI0037A50DB5